MMKSLCSNAIQNLLMAVFMQNLSLHHTVQSASIARLKRAAHGLDALTDCL